MNNYSFEVLKLKKDKINNLYRFFIISSISLIILFIFLIVFSNRDRILRCNKVISNDTGKFNYSVLIKLDDSGIKSINGRQIVEITNQQVLDKLFNLVNDDIVNNNIDGLKINSKLYRNSMILNFSIDNANEDNLVVVNNLLGVYNIDDKSGYNEIIYNYEYEGYLCN